MNAAKKCLRIRPENGQQRAIEADLFEPKAADNFSEGLARDDLDRLKTRTPCGPGTLGRRRWSLTCNSGRGCRSRDSRGRGRLSTCCCPLLINSFLRGS